MLNLTLLNLAVGFCAMSQFPKDQFEDILSANTQFVDHFQHSELTGTARKGLAIVTCMDSRISPLAVVGMQAGDAKILRNAA